MMNPRLKCRRKAQLGCDIFNRGSLYFNVARTTVHHHPVLQLITPMLIQFLAPGVEATRTCCKIERLLQQFTLNNLAE